MAKECKCGQMGRSMMVSGEMEWLKELVLLIMLMEMSIKENSCKIEPMDMGCMFTLMDKDMKDIGKMICRKVQAKNNLKMEVNMMDCLKMERNGGLALTTGLINHNTQENGLIITLKEKVNIAGLMVEYIRENGKKTNYTDEESTRGPMEEFMMENMKMIRSTVTEYILGLMVNVMTVAGKKVNSMVKPSSQILKAVVNSVSGKTVIKCDG